MQRCIVWLWLCLWAAPVSAGKIYLMGGGYADGNTELFVDGLRKATGRDANFVPNPASTSNCGTNWATTACPRIAVVTSAKATYALGLDAFQIDLGTGSSRKRGYYNLFQSHGFSPKFITAHVDNYQTHARSGNSAGDANIALLQQADVIWFCGGDQALIARTWLNDDGSDSPIAAALRSRFQSSNNVIVGGDSAGNHAMNATMHGVGISYGYLYFGADLNNQTVTQYQNFGDTRDGLSALRYEDNGATMKGLSLLPASLLSDTHFDARSGRLGRLLAALRELNLNQGFGVDEDTGVLVDPMAQTMRVYGSGSLIVADTSAATFPSASYFRISNARVSLLTSGDSYNYQSRSVLSSKPAIVTRYYTGHRDSADIFAAYETSTLLTRVVDQSSSYNLGIAPAPDYTSAPFYPASAPDITLRFTRDASTRGHLSGGRYTAIKVKVDIQ